MIKHLIIFILIYCSQVKCGVQDISWDYTHYVYLAKPIYIFRVESVVTQVAGKLDKSLRDLVIKVHEAQEALNTVHYYFEIEDVLYGEEKSIYHMKFFYKNIYEDCRLNDSFNDHTDEEFWNKTVGRSLHTNWPNNHSIYSCFNLNEKYLLIGNYDFGIKRFEVVKSVDDQWLKYVKEKVKTITPYEVLYKEYKKTLKKVKVEKKLGE